jgi:hypothetical protein
MGGTITIDDKSKDFSTPIPDYFGGPLYCKALVSGNTLVILIDKDGPNALGPWPGTLATHVSIVVKSQISSSPWAGELPAPYQGGELDFAIQAYTDLRVVNFAIRAQANAAPTTNGLAAVPGAHISPDPAADTGSAADAGPALTADPGPPSAASSGPAVGSAAGASGGDDNDVDLGYIAVEVEGQPGTVQLFFLDHPPTITNFPRLKTATIIPPTDLSGSIGGPMGVGLTS